MSERPDARFRRPNEVEQTVTQLIVAQQRILMLGQQDPCAVAQRPQTLVARVFDGLQVRGEPVAEIVEPAAHDRRLANAIFEFCTQRLQ